MGVDLPHGGGNFELNVGKLKANPSNQKAHPNGGCAVTASWDASAAPAKLNAPVVSA